jgi:sulfite exporter TauE/SafE
MTHVIGSPVWAADKGFRAGRSFIIFLFFAAFGGVATGGLLGALLPGYDVAWLLFAGISLSLLARDWFRPGIPLPQVRLQVPPGLKGRRTAGPIVYGVLLGAGILTYLPSAVVYIYVVALLLLATPLTGALAGLVFGVSYAAAVLLLGRRTRFLTPLAQAGTIKRSFATHRNLVLLTASALVSLLVVLASPV